MKKIVAMQNRLKEVNNSFISKAIDEVLIIEEGEIINLVTEHQLYQGIDAQGKELKPEYAESTIRSKKRKGQPTDRVTLKDKGLFYGDIYVNQSGQSFKIDVHEFQKQLLQKLEEKYSQHILGLTDEHKIFVVQKIIKPYLSKKIKNKVLNRKK